MKYHMNSSILKMCMGLHLDYVVAAGTIAILTSLDEDGLLEDLNEDMFWYMLGRKLECPYEEIIKSYREIATPVKKTHRKKTEFEKPKLDDVIAYCRERKNNVDPMKWYAFYESRNWKVGRETMKDWKASIRYWERNELNRGGNSNTHAGRAAGDDKGEWDSLSPDEQAEIRRVAEESRRLGIGLV